MIRLKLDPKNFEKIKTINVAKIEIAKKFIAFFMNFWKYCIKHNFKFAKFFLNMYKNLSLSIYILWQKLKLKIQ